MSENAARVPMIEYVASAPAATSRSNDRVCGILTCRFPSGTCTGEWLRGAHTCRLVCGTSFSERGCDIHTCGHLCSACSSFEDEGEAEGVQRQDALEQAIQQAEEERAMEADLMARVWSKRPEQCHCGLSLPKAARCSGAKSVPSCFARRLKFNLAKSRRRMVTKVQWLK